MRKGKPMNENAVPLPEIPERRYERPPVVEALCEIYFTGSAWDLTVPGRFYDRVSTDYPKKSQVASVGIEVQIGPDQAHTHRHPFESRVRFARADDSRIIQL